MVIETQWFVTRLARASQTPKAPVSPGRRGYVPAIWEAIENRPGMWTGMLPVHGARIALTAVSFDTSVVDSATRLAEFGKLQDKLAGEVAATCTVARACTKSWKRRRPSRVAERVERAFPSGRDDTLQRSPCLSPLGLRHPNY